MTFQYPMAGNSWDEREAAAIHHVMESKRLEPGEQIERFEIEFRQILGAPYCVMVESGAMAMMIAVAACFAPWDEQPLLPGCKVLVPAFCHAETYTAAALNDMEPLLIDAGNDWQPKAARQRNRNDPPDWMSAGARLLITASMLGFPAMMQDFQWAASKMRIPMIEDCTDSLGVASIGTTVGQFGRFGIFDIGADKQLSAVKGGVIVCAEEEDAEKCRMLRDGGRVRMIGIHGPLDFENEFISRMLGYNAWPSELNAAIARIQLRKLPEGRVWRQKNFATFKAMIGADSDMLGLYVPGVNEWSNPLGIHFVVRSSDIRTTLAHKLRANGIDCRLPAAGSFRLQPAGISCIGQTTPLADAIHHRGLVIGNAPYDLTDQIERAVAILKS